MNREGIGLLRALIDRNEALNGAVRNGNCAAMAIVINGWLPGDMSVTATDVYEAIKNRPDFAPPKLNVELLRARIDAMPVLYSARISGSLQAILNELRLDPTLAIVTMSDVEAAMKLRAVPKPANVAQGSVAMVGSAFLG